MNETLLRAMYAAGLGEEDIAAQLEVDPKTVRRWMDGRLPFPKYRRLLARLLNSEEPAIWPELLSLPGSRSRPAELAAVYPQRNAVSKQGWVELFRTAEREIDILDCNSLFLAEDQRLIQLLASKAHGGVAINLALGNPDGMQVALRGRAETIGEIRNALELYKPLLNRPGVNLRLHDAVLYNSMFRADDQLLVNQHVYGIPAGQTPVYHLRRVDDDGMFSFYMESFAEVWKASVPIRGGNDPRDVRGP